MHNWLVMNSSSTNLTRTRLPPGRPDHLSANRSVGTDRCRLHVVADVGLELAEIGREPLGDRARGLIVSGAVGPGRPRIEHLIRHARALRRHGEAELRVLAHR